MSNLNLNQSLAKIIDDLDFERAFKRVKYDARYDFLRLPVEISIFEAHYQENIKHLKESIEQGTYEVKNLRRIWVPKRGYFLRPGSIPHLEDRILFQAVVDKIAVELEAQLPPFEQQVVFSSRLAQDLQSKSFYSMLEGGLLLFRLSLDCCPSSSWIRANAWPNCSRSSATSASSC